MAMPFQQVYTWPCHHAFTKILKCSTAVIQQVEHSGLPGLTGHSKAALQQLLLSATIHTWLSSQQSSHSACAARSHNPGGTNASTRPLPSTKGDWALHLPLIFPHLSKLPVKDTQRSAHQGCRHRAKVPHFGVRHCVSNQPPQLRALRGRWPEAQLRHAGSGGISACRLPLIACNAADLAGPGRLPCPPVHMVLAWPSSLSVGLDQVDWACLRVRACSTP